MLAAKYKHPRALRLLLRECDPREDVHKTQDGMTVLHLAMDSNAWSDASNDEKLRARKVAQILLEKGGVDPTETDAAGRTAFDVAHAYEDARRVLRHDKRMPRDYDRMTPKMRIDDLTSRKPAIVLDLLRAAPQALTDRHEGETGFHILVRTKNVQVLAIVLREALIADQPMHAELRGLTDLACQASAGTLRTALIGRLNGDAAEAEFLPLLLNASVDAKDKAAISALQGHGAVYLRGDNVLGSSVFHDLAIQGHHEDFERTVALLSLPFALPLDDWGRRPSELATQGNRRRFHELEQKLFSAPRPEQARSLQPTKFHEYARKGDVKRFEQQLRGGCTVVPLDAEGKRPSEVAPDEKKAEIAALEARYCKKVS
jgi:ankyrin repeat protein